MTNLISDKIDFLSCSNNLFILSRYPMYCFLLKSKSLTKICLGVGYLGLLFSGCIIQVILFSRKVSQVIVFATYFLVLHFTPLGTIIYMLDTLLFCVCHSLPNLSLGASSFLFHFFSPFCPVSLWHLLILSLIRSALFKFCFMLFFLNC